MGRGTVRALVAASIAMAVLIVLGVATLLAVVARRAMVPGGGPVAAVAAVAPAAPVVLAEPAGTRIAGAVGPAEALVLRLQGGGADRVVVIDARTGRVLARVGLAP